jgi:hypothetical protein
MADSPQRYLTSEDLADILQLSVKTIYNRVSLIKNHKARGLDLLPTISSLPGTAGPRWTPRAVAQWQAKYDREDAEPKRRPGRPTKAETIARRLSQSVANN